jgi:hypothetical protein
MDKKQHLNLFEYSRQYSKWLDDIASLLKTLSVEKNHFFDYGCGVGVWGMVASKFFSKVTGADFEDKVQRGKLLLKHNNINNASFINLKKGVSDLDNLEIEPIDTLISIMVIELIPASQVIDLFKFASKNLSKNGKFIIVTRKRIGFIRTLVTFERFFYSSFYKAVKVLFVLFRGFVISIFSSEIKRSERTRFYHNKKEIVNTAKKFNLKLSKGPKEMAKMDSVKSLERNISVERFFNFRQSNWYLFKKNSKN